MDIYLVCARMHGMIECDENKGVLLDRFVYCRGHNGSGPRHFNEVAN
jgi:hypothetical protein